MNYTPGPWIVGHQCYSTMPVYAEGAQGVTVADCGMNAIYAAAGSYAITSAEMEANAQLIASAPQMLALLMYAETHTVDDNDGWRDEMQSLLNRLGYDWRSRCNREDGA